MSEKPTSIPVKSLSKEYDKGIAMGQFPHHDLHLSEEAGDSHRHDYHFFILQEKGKSFFEIDFEKHNITKPSIIYIAPNQVHRALHAEKAEFYLLAISNEHLQPEYLKLLAEISPAKPLALNTKDFSLMNQAADLCIQLFARKKNKFYLPLLKDSCNTFVALIISQYLEKLSQTAHLPRFDKTTKTFKLALEKNFTTERRPAGYAKKLNISVPYLNECVKNTTGFPVSHHIQQRVILEAKRLLYHSNKSVKEIAILLGYEDYAYFSRLFAKTTGMSASAFRSKNHD